MKYVQDVSYSLLILLIFGVVFGVVVPLFFVQLAICSIIKRFRRKI